MTQGPAMNVDPNNDSTKVVQEYVEKGNEYLNTGEFRLAIESFEHATDVEEDSAPIWRLVAISHYQNWQKIVRDRRKTSFINHIASTESSKFHPLREEYLLRETYNNFIVAMDYKENKILPGMLLRLARLYLEMKSFDGALSVCTLLVESYKTFPSLNEALFISAVSAKALKLHAQSASYFSYLVESPPYKLKSYILPLLAAREYEFCAGARTQARNSFSQAYQLMISRNADVVSEVTAQKIRREKSETERIQMWYMDRDTWYDVANHMLDIDFPTMALDAISQASCRLVPPDIDISPAFKVAQSLSYHRIKLTAEATSVMESALSTNNNYYYYECVPRFFLANWNDDWKYQFEYEDWCATVITKRVRGNFGRKAAEKRKEEVYQALLRRSATTIQCAYRVYLAKKEIKVLREERRKVEAWENIKMSREDALMIYKVQSSYARTIQGLFHIFKAKTLRNSLKVKREKTRELLQLALGNSDNRRKQLVLQGFKDFRLLCINARYDGAVVIQCAIRSYGARRTLRLKKKFKDHQDRLITLALGRQSEAMLEKCFKAWRVDCTKARNTRDCAARVIQSQYKTYRAQLSYSVAIAQQRRTMRIMRQMLMAREHHTVYMCYKSIQKNMYQMRDLKRQKAVEIQRVFRGFCGRKVARKAYSRSKKCAKYVVICHRKAKLRLIGKAFQSLELNVELCITYRHVQAVVIQKHVRGMLSRIHTRHLRDYNLLYCRPDLSHQLKNLRCEDVLRLSFRALCEYGPHVCRTRNTAATKIQAWIKGIFTRVAIKESARQTLVKKKVAGFIQRSCYRNATVFFRELERLANITRKIREDATRVIQRWIKKIFARQNLVRLAVERKRRHKVGLRIVNRHRYMLMRKILYAMQEFVILEEKGRIDAVIRIQRQYRVRAASKRSRCAMAKKSMQQKLLQNAGSKPIQYCFRKWQQALVEKNVLTIRSCVRKPLISSKILSNVAKHTMASPDKEKAWKDGRYSVPGMQFYTVLQQVRSTGLCRLPTGVTFNDSELQKILILSRSVVLDAHSVKSSSSSDNVLDAMERLPESPVQKLIIYNSFVERSRILKLGECLQRPSHHLTSVALGNTFIGNAGAQVLAMAIVNKNCRLTQLLVDRCGVGNTGACCLAEAISHNRTVRKLDLSGNHITDVSCKALSHAMITNTSLTVLGLSDNDISDSGVIGYLAIALGNVPNMTSLEQLLLGGNPKITIIGRSALEESAREFRRITRKRNETLEIQLDHSLGNIGSLTF